MLQLFRVKTRLAIAITIAAGLLFAFTVYGPPPTSQATGNLVKPTVGLFHTKASHKFWNEVFAVFSNNELAYNEDQLRLFISYVPGEMQLKGDVKTKEVLLSMAEVSPDFVAELSEKHAKVLAELPKKFDSSTFKKGLYGAVVIGGGKYSWLSYLSVLALRDTGSTLPVQVVMPTYADFESEVFYCHSILPALNAECIVVPDVLGPTVMLNWNSKFSAYQFKSLAVIASTFQHIVLLDSDNVVLSNPQEIFDSDLYKNTGMITWPDYWARTILPHFFDVAGVKVNEGTRLRYNKFPLTKQLPDDNGSLESPYNDLEGTIPDLSTESGQMFINKGTHALTLLLSLYYNVFGPQCYYRLLSMGAPGEGDKETFIPAAIFSNEPYYQVKSHIKTYGYSDSNDNFNGIAMGQSNPVVDHAKFLEKVIENTDLVDKSVDEQIEILKVIDKEVFDLNKEIPLFAIHCNYPKLDPLNLFTLQHHYDELNQRLKFRMYSHFKYQRNTTDAENIITTHTIDFELQMWKNIHRALCDEKLKFTHFATTKMEDICAGAKNQVAWLSESSKVK